MDWAILSAVSAPLAVFKAIAEGELPLYFEPPTYGGLMTWGAPEDFPVGRMGAGDLAGRRLNPLVMSTPITLVEGVTPVQTH